MQLTTATAFLTLLATFSTIWSTLASPVLLKKDVYNPPIISPDAASVFTAGESTDVCWDASVLPKDSENVGTILLGFLTEDSENLDVQQPLAQNFLLRSGCQEVTLPADLPTKDNYIVVVMGDSGNRSPMFTINERI